MSDYKFLHSANIDSIVVNGTIRISSLSHYRLLEGEQWIADRLEGAVEVNVDNLIVKGNETKEFAPEGFGALVKAEGGAVIEIINSIFRYEHPDVFVFCASRGDLPSLANTMCQDGKDQYDACVRIVDIEYLAHRMFHRGVIVEMNNDKVCKIFTGYKCKQVAYENLSRDMKMAAPPSPNPFLKHNIFTKQCEVRIAFQPRQAISLNILTIKIPKPAKSFVEEFRRHHVC